MAIADLLTTLESEGRARAAALVAAARTEADRLVHEATDRIAARRAVRLAEQQRELKASGAVTLDLARRDAARQLLRARTDLLDRVLTRARQLLPEAAVARPRNSLATDLSQALACFGGGRTVVHCPPLLAAQIRDLVADAAVRVEPDATGATLTIAAEDGSLEVDASLTTRLERLRPRLAIELLRDLEVAS
jgi:vacuolar-type H+-ATPase subunit E/Vma4